MNYLSVIVAALMSFALGGLWYSPAMFGNIWCHEALGKKMEDVKNPHGSKIFILAFIASLIATVVFATLLTPESTLTDTLCLSLKIGAGFVATSFATNYAFAGRTFKLFAIDAGYHIVQFFLFGLVIGLWPK